MKYRISPLIALALAATAAAKQTPAGSIHCAVMTDRVLNIADATRGHMYADYKGRRYFFCCGYCPDEFKRNPEKYTMNESIETPAGAPATPAPFGLKEAVITGVYFAGSPTSALPDWINRAGPNPELIILIKGSPDMSPVVLRDFYKRAGHDFVLKAKGKPDTKVTLKEHDFNDDKGKYQGYYATIDPAKQSSIKPGVEYRFEPVAKKGETFWRLEKPIVLRLTKKP